MHNKYKMLFEGKCLLLKEGFIGVRKKKKKGMAKG
jgi:hypothetical protein